MSRRTRLIATATTVAALAGPLAAGASASTPSLPDIGAALTGAGVSSGNAASIASELAALQAGTATSLGALNVLDTALTTLQGSLLVSLLNPVATLELVVPPSGPTNIENILADLHQIGAAGGTAAVDSAVSELSAALSTAGLGSLLTQITGANSTLIGNALTALAGLQSLAPGATVSSSALAPVGALVSDLATQVGSGNGGYASLNSAATLLDAATVTPAQLETAAADLSAASTSLSSSLAPVATALANQLAASGSLFGGLASVGNAPSSSTVSAALTGIAALPSLAPGATVPSTDLASLGTILSAVAGEPGVSSASLTSAATALGGSMTPSQLLSTIASLGGVSGLPAPLGPIVSQVAAGLGSSGTIFGLPALSAGQVTSAVNALAALPSLAAGAPVSGGALAPVGTVLSEIATQPGVSSADQATLGGLVTTLTSASITPTQLLAATSTLGGLGDLPAPYAGVVSGIAGRLAASGSIFGAVAGLTSGQVTSALGDLTTLSGLSSGWTSLPALPGIATVLSTIAGEPGVAGTPLATPLTSAASQLTAGSVVPSALQSLISALAGVVASTSPALPSPLAPVVSDLAGVLTTAGQLAGTVTSGGTGGTGSGGTGSGGTGSGGTGTGSGSGGTGSGSGGTGTGATGTGGTGTGSTGAGAAGLTAAELAAFQALFNEIKALRAAIAKAALHSGIALISRATHTGNTVAVALTCNASAGRTCVSTVSATRYGRTVRRTVRLAGGGHTTVRLSLPKRAAHRGTSLITVVAATGPLSTMRSVR